MTNFETSKALVKTYQLKTKILISFIACGIITCTLLPIYGLIEFTIPIMFLILTFGILILDYNNKIKNTCTQFLEQRFEEIKRDGKDRVASDTLIDVLGFGETCVDPSVEFLIDTTCLSFIDTRSVDIFKRYAIHEAELEKEFPTPSLKPIKPTIEAQGHFHN